MGISYCRILDTRHAEYDAVAGCYDKAFARPKYRNKERYNVSSGNCTPFYMANWITESGRRISPTVHDFIWGNRPRFSARQCRKICAFLEESVRNGDEGAKGRSYELAIDLIRLLRHANRGIYMI